MMELINDESILRKVVKKINKNTSTKLKSILVEIEQVNKDIQKINTRKNKNYFKAKYLLKVSYQQG